MAIQVTLSDLKSKVDAGWKRDALATHYELPKQQMSKLLKDAGLTIRKFHAPKYELVDDTTGTDINDVIIVGEVSHEEVMEQLPQMGAEVPASTTSPGQDW